MFTHHGSIELATCTLRWHKERRELGLRTSCTEADLDFVVDNCVLAYARFHSDAIRISSRYNELSLFEPRMTLPAGTPINDVVQAVISFLCISGGLANEDQN